MKCEKRLAVAKEHKSVNREAFRVDWGEPGHYSDLATIRTPPLLMNWPPEPRPLFELSLYTGKYCMYVCTFDIVCTVCIVERLSGNTAYTCYYILSSLHSISTSMHSFSLPQCDCHFNQPRGDLSRPCLLQLHCGQLPFLQHHLASQWD